MSDTGYVPPPAPEGGRAPAASDTSKLLAALSYPLWLPVGIIALLIEPYKDEPFVKYHAIQGIALGVALWVVSFIVGLVPLLGWVVSPLLVLAYIIYSIVLALKAYQGEYFEVPGVYGFIRNYVS